MYASRRVQGLALGLLCGFALQCYKVFFTLSLGGVFCTSVGGRTGHSLEGGPMADFFLVLITFCAGGVSFIGTAYGVCMYI